MELTLGTHGIRLSRGMWLPLLFVSGCFICFTVWCNWRYPITPLRWRHNGQDSVWNHQPHHCLLNRLFIRRSKKTSKLRVTALFVGNSPGTDEFPEHLMTSSCLLKVSIRTPIMFVILEKWPILFLYSFIYQSFYWQHRFDILLP